MSSTVSTNTPANRIRYRITLSANRNTTCTQSWQRNIGDMSSEQNQINCHNTEMRQRIFRCLSFIIFLVIIENTLCCAILFFYVYFRILTKQQHAAKSTFLVKLGFFNFDYFNLSKKILVFKGFFASSWIKFNSYFCFFRSCFSCFLCLQYSFIIMK